MPNLAKIKKERLKNEIRIGIRSRVDRVKIVNKLGIFGVQLWLLFDALVDDFCVLC
jgi:hypothetical protein